MYFFLMLIGIVILTVGINRNKKQKVTFTNLLRREEIDIDEIDIVIGELRMEFSSTILELQKDVMELSEKVDAFTKIQKPEVPSISIRNIEKEKSSKDGVSKKNKSTKVNNDLINNEVFTKAYANENENKNSSKISEISELLDKGISIDDICEKVQMGRGEILLIKELYLK